MNFGQKNQAPCWRRWPNGVRRRVMSSPRSRLAPQSSRYVVSSMDSLGHWKTRLVWLTISDMGVSSDNSLVGFLTGRGRGRVNGR